MLVPEFLGRLTSKFSPALIFCSMVVESFRSRRADQYIVKTLSRNARTVSDCSLHFLCDVRPILRYDFTEPPSRGVPDDLVRSPIRNIDQELYCECRFRLPQGLL
jgi:hypothetical protein